MKVFVFQMDNGTEYPILAATFAMACKIFDQFGEDPRDILEMREYGADIYEAV